MATNNPAVQDEHQFTAASVKRSVQILAEEVGIHPQIAVETFDVAAYLKALLETERDALSDEDLDQFNTALGRFLEEEVDAEIEPAAVVFGLWLQLRSVGHSRQSAESDQESGRMFQ